MTVIQSLASAIASSDYVDGLTHKFYRYPARFPPEFAQAAIETFSTQADTVLDPFSGGGTSIVEAMAAGRRAIGVDLNSLGVFVARAKTTPLSSNDRNEIEDWLSSRRPAIRKANYVDEGFARHSKDVPEHLQRHIAAEVGASLEMSSSARRFVRCAILRTGQWALDCRERVPTCNEFVNTLVSNGREMLQHLAHFETVAGQAAGVPRSRLSSRRRLVHSNITDVTPSVIPSGWSKPRLVVTSPPYVGVHVLYNRWQVRGRRETTIPYAISGTPDGFFASHYTFAPRGRPIEDYALRLVDAFAAVRRVIAKDALIVQLVAFSDPRRNLARFLDAMEAAGFSEEREIRTRRLWRSVPNRKWYNRTNEHRAPASREVLLLHRPS